MSGHNWRTKAMRVAGVSPGRARSGARSTFRSLLTSGIVCNQGRRKTQFDRRGRSVCQLGCNRLRPLMLVLLPEFVVLRHVGHRVPKSATAETRSPGIASNCQGTQSDQRRKRRAEAVVEHKGLGYGSSFFRVFFCFFSCLPRESFWPSRIPFGSHPFLTLFYVRKGLSESVY